MAVKPTYLINTASLLREAFGVSPLGFYHLPSIRDDRAFDYREIQVLDKNEGMPLSVFGTPVLDRITLRDEFGEYTFPDASMVDVSQQKNIETTTVNNREGTVKEYISVGDHEITIRGLIVHEQSKYPSALVADMNAMFKVNKAVKAESRLFVSLGIDTIVLRNVRYSHIEGYSNVVAFEMSALSDMPIELTIKEGL